MKKLIIIPIALLLLCACNTTPPKSDTELFFEFYNNVMVRVKSFDDRYKPFINAVTNGQTIEAIGIASEIDKDLLQLWSKIDRLSVPDLKNQMVLKELTNAKDYLSSAYLNKHEALLNYLEYSKNPSLFSLSTMKQKATKSQGQLVIGMASLFSAGSMLGLKPKEITAGKVMPRPNSTPIPTSTWKSGGQYPNAIKQVQLIGKESNGQLNMYAVISDIKTNQIKPTLLAAFEGTIKKHPQYKTISIGIGKNEQDVKAKNFLAKVFCTTDNIFLTIGDTKEIIKIEKQR